MAVVRLRDIVTVADRADVTRQEVMSGGDSVITLTRQAREQEDGHGCT